MPRSQVDIKSGLGATGILRGLTVAADFTLLVNAEHVLCNIDSNGELVIPASSGPAIGVIPSGKNIGDKADVLTQGFVICQCQGGITAGQSLMHGVIGGVQTLSGNTSQQIGIAWEDAANLEPVLVQLTI